MTNLDTSDYIKTKDVLKVINKSKSLNRMLYPPYHKPSCTINTTTETYVAPKISVDQFIVGLADIESQTITKCSYHGCSEATKEYCQKHNEKKVIKFKYNIIDQSSYIVGTEKKIELSMHVTSSCKCSLID